MSTEQRNGIFSRLYRTRIIVDKGATRIANLSLLFCIIAALTAPWLFIGSVIAAMALGCSFSRVSNAAEFCGDFNTVVREAKDNVRSAVDSFTGSSQS